MSRLDMSFARLVAAARSEVEVFLPEAAAEALEEATAPFMTLIAMSRCTWSARLLDHEVTPVFACAPFPQDCEFAQQICAWARAQAVLSATPRGGSFGLNLEPWIAQQGFLRLVTRLALLGAETDRIHALACLLGNAVSKLATRMADLVKAQNNVLVDRDLSSLVRSVSGNLSEVARWALTPDLAGSCSRAEIVKRRTQALVAYGAVASLLAEPDVTAIIDKGEALKPQLKKRLGVNEAQLHILNGCRPISEVMNSWSDYRSSINRLLLYSVPPHQWPARGSWDETPWKTGNNMSLIRPDFLGSDSQARDALNALRQDILAPLARHRAQMFGLEQAGRVPTFLSYLEIFGELQNGPLHRRWYSVLHRAIVGTRQASGFLEGVGFWHRRAATLSAIRHEAKAEQPGWPGLCRPWTTADGTHRVLALCDAAALVGEGRALDHCVGGYYGQCRLGGTQIFSVREGERQVATLELLIDEAPSGALSITLGQFKGRANARPAPHLWAAVREFLTDLRSGAHVVDAQGLRTYRRKMRRTGDYAYSAAPLSLSHAAQAWSFYQPLLPKPAPQTLEGWAHSSGLIDVMDEIIHAVAGKARQHGSTSLEEASNEPL